MTKDKIEKAVIYYDGDCPFCSRYVDYVRFAENVGDIALVDLRSATDHVHRLKALNYNLDEGMILEVDGTLYHGSEAIHQISLISNRGNFFNKLNYFLFRNKVTSKTLYPVLRAIRNLTLKILGKKKIHQ